MLLFQGIKRVKAGTDDTMRAMIAMMQAPRRREKKNQEMQVGTQEMMAANKLPSRHLMKA
jgi:hypothetical protein